MLSKCLKVYCFVCFCNLYLYQQNGTNKNIIIKMIIKIEYKAKIRKDDELLLELATANRKGNRSVRVATVERWLRDDNPILTTVTNLAIIKRRFGIVENDELLAEETIA